MGPAAWVCVDVPDRDQPHLPPPRTTRPDGMAPVRRTPLNEVRRAAYPGSPSRRSRPACPYYYNNTRGYPNRLPTRPWGAEPWPVRPARRFPVRVQARASVVPAGSSLEDARSRSSLSICALRIKAPAPPRASALCRMSGFGLCYAFLTVFVRSTRQRRARRCSRGDASAAATGRRHDIDLTRVR